LILTHEKFSQSLEYTTHPEEWRRNKNLQARSNVILFFRQHNNPTVTVAQSSEAAINTRSERQYQTYVRSTAVHATQLRRLVDRVNRSQTRRDNPQSMQVRNHARDDDPHKHYTYSLYKSSEANDTCGLSFYTQLTTCYPGNQESFPE